MGEAQRVAGEVAIIQLSTPRDYIHLILSSVTQRLDTPLISVSIHTCICVSQRTEAKRGNKDCGC